MLLRLVPEFELRRDVVPWLAERGCAAALGNAPGGRGQRQLSGRPSLPLSGRLRARRAAARPPGAGPQRELLPRAGDGGGGEAPEGMAP